MPRPSVLAVAGALAPVRAARAVLWLLLCAALAQAADALYSAANSPPLSEFVTNGWQLGNLQGVVILILLQAARPEGALVIALLAALGLLTRLSLERVLCWALVYSLLTGGAGLLLPCVAGSAELTTCLHGLLPVSVLSPVILALILATARRARRCRNRPEMTSVTALILLVWSANSLYSGFMWAYYQPAALRFQSSESVYCYENASVGLLWLICTVLTLRAWRPANQVLLLALLAVVAHVLSGPLGNLLYPGPTTLGQRCCNVLTGLWRHWDDVLFEHRTLLLLSAVLTWYWWPLRRIPSSPTADGHPRCQCCGYDLHGNLAARCPECGQAF